MPKQDHMSSREPSPSTNAHRAEGGEIKSLTPGKPVLAQIAAAEPVFEQRKVHELGGYYLASFSDGSILATGDPKGLRERAMAFADAQAAYDFFRPMASESHAAWNLCYALEDLIEEEGQ